MTWITANWLIVTWCAVLVGLAILLGVFGVRWWREVEGDPRETAAFDAYLDDVEDGYIDLPGPASAPPDEVSRELAHSRRAGELHYMDTWLGRPGDGSEHTALRVRREGEAMLSAFEAEQAEWWSAPPPLGMGMTTPWRGLAVAA